jgi:hypothetical protein
MTDSPEADIFDRLNEWIAETNADNSEIKTILYKYDHPTTGNAKCQVCQWVNEIPEAHQVGLMFGSGRYLIWVNIKALKKYKAYNFRIHQYYDELRRQQSAAGQVPGGGYGNSPIILNTPPAAQGNGGQSLDAAFSMIERLMSIMLPLIASKQAQQVDPLAMMTGVYSGVNKIMQRNMIETQQLMTEMQRARLTGPENEDNDYDDMEGTTMPEEKPVTLFEQIAPLIQQFLPVLIGTGPKAAAMANTVQSLPQFKQVLSRPDELKKIVAHLEKTQGKEKTAKLLKRLNVAAPAGGEVQK